MFGKRKHNDIFFGYNTKKNKKTKDSEKSDDEESIKDNLLSSLSKKNSDTKIERENNHIYFYSEVERESIFELIALIREAEEESILTSLKLNIDEVPILLHINSLGGSVYNALLAIDVITSCKVPIHTIIEGATASAGTLISIVGKKRYIRPSARMLIHQLSSECWGKMSEIEDEYQNLKDLMEEIKKIYKDNTSIPKKEIEKILKHDLWFDSNKCIQYGLADELWTSSN